MRRTLAVLALVGALAPACKDKDNTRIVVAVWSDLAVPAKLDTIRIDVTGSTGTAPKTFPLTAGSEAGKTKLPVTLDLVPLGAKDATFTVKATGLHGQTEVVAQAARISFVAGQTLLLKLFLARDCQAATCPADYTCAAGACNQPIAITNLPPYSPSQLLSPPDAGAALDAGGGGSGGTGGTSNLDGPRETGGAAGNDARPIDGFFPDAVDAPLGGTGGAVASGGVVGTGGIAGTSGASTGGTVGGTGGMSGAGGTVASGGVVGTGGIAGTGGASAVGTVGGTGGTSGAGGTVASGGVVGTGGIAGTGKATGVGCVASAECQAGLTCLDGVCCTEAACPQCHNCGTDGTCSITVSTADDTTGTTCTGTSTCNPTGVCKKKNGEICSIPADCATAACTDNHCCSQTCGTCQACTGAGGTCVTITNAENASNCMGTNTCDASGVCKKKNGQACTSPANCASGACTDSHCCSQTCGTCQACNGVGGTCVAVTNADDTDTCTGSNTCDAIGVCKKKNGQACSSDAVCASTSHCNSNGICAPIRCLGLATTCGASMNGDCCSSLPVPGGTFYRSYDGSSYSDMSYPATVASFYLDKYEITVGRFRQFVDAGMGTQATPPASSSGAHPSIVGSGWNSAWNANLPTTTANLKGGVKCSPAYQTWSDTPSSNENKPQNCLDWYTAFAFCIWDGGRLPTEAEWNYAASGGSEQRVYPWSNPPTSTAIDDSYAVYCGASCTSGDMNVGMKSPKGDGKWGQSDLGGNEFEWVLDWYADPYSAPCDNCANLTPASMRVWRGSSYYLDAMHLWSSFRGWNFPTAQIAGARCARNSL
jgi:formylglycine-generating enzyme required for sulfatase activity